MKLEVKRFSFSNEDTLGLLFINDKFECFTLEDERREIKVPNETAIPPGTYNITLRTEGGMHENYKRRFSFHRGMLWIRNIPSFEYVYIHIGNDEGDTGGCILVGDVCYTNINGYGSVSKSTVCYERIYKKILSAIVHGEPVKFTIGG